MALKVYWESLFGFVALLRVDRADLPPRLSLLLLVFLFVLSLIEWRAVTDSLLVPPEARSQTQSPLHLRRLRNVFAWVRGKRGGDS